MAPFAAADIAAKILLVIKADQLMGRWLSDTAIVKNGQWPISLQLLDYMMQNSIRPDIVSFNTAIATCKEQGQWEIALQLLESMVQEQQIQHDVFSYTSAIFACVKHGNYTVAMQLYNTIIHNNNKRIIMAVGHRLWHEQPGGRS
jgi:pentatricopeptide repeat protein